MTAATTAATAPSVSLSKPVPIPSWEVQILDYLQGAGKLSGVPAAILEVIDKAESTGEGGGINPEQFGGFFGLAVTGKYPAGTSTRALLATPGSSSFTTQAEIAASDFAEMLNEFGGTAVRAEEAYQTGPNAKPNPSGEGATLFREYLTGTSVAGATPSTSSTASTTKIPILGTLPGFSLIPGVGGGSTPVTGAIGNGITSAFQALFKPVEDAAFIFFGLVFIIVGLIVFAHGMGKGSSTPAQPGTAPGGKGEKGAAGEGEEAAEAAAVAA